ncbi:hypothetical protein, partial [Pseudomonas aeruginosa]
LSHGEDSRLNRCPGSVDHYKDVPSWAKGDRPYQGESGKDFAKRIMDQKYGKGNWKDGPGSEYNQIKKWGDRSFIDPK